VSASESSKPLKNSKNSKPSEPSTHPKALFPYPVLRYSISSLNIYLSQAYSSDDVDEEENLKTITNCIRRLIRLILKRVCEREEVFNMSLVLVKMTENQAVLFHQRLEQGNINPVQHDPLGYEIQMLKNQI
jgi:hypothetical protein